MHECVTRSVHTRTHALARARARATPHPSSRTRMHTCTLAYFEPLDPPHCTMPRHTTPRHTTPHHTTQLETVAEKTKEEVDGRLEAVETRATRLETVETRLTLSLEAVETTAKESKEEHRARLGELEAGAMRSKEAIDKAVAGLSRYGKGQSSPARGKYHEASYLIDTHSIFDNVVCRTILFHKLTDGRFQKF